MKIEIENAEFKEIVKQALEKNQNEFKDFSEKLFNDNKDIKVFGKIVGQRNIDDAIKHAFTRFIGGGGSLDLANTYLYKTGVFEGWLKMVERFPDGKISLDENDCRLLGILS